MPLASGHKLAHYEIAESIGKGGMGEVYRARDTKLGRDVAIKVLPEEFAADAERVARFKREAKVLASLNHPKIAGIHGLEESGDTHYLVMELVPGETLAERIARGAIPSDEALTIAIQIAEALEEAHERVVVHRDLKPANVKLTPEDQVKVLDFGLAKAFGDEAPEADSSMSPTITRNATRVGVILGTAAYMSPEQAKGKRVDKRADVFAFGAVLYEMLTGKKAFPGDDVSEVLAAVIKLEPDWKALPVTVDHRVTNMLRRCLEKDPKKRRRDIGDVRVDLEEVASGGGASLSHVATTRESRPLWQWALPAALALVLGTLVGFGLSRRPDPEKPVLRFSIPLPQDVRFTGTGRHIVALSPDGKRLAHTGNNQIYLREMDQPADVAVRGTGGGGSARDAGGSPFFSPDSQWLGFWADGKLKKIAVSGGAPVVLCDADNPSGASWTEENTIVYGQGDAGIWQVSSDGGEPEQLVELREGEGLAHGPQMLPGGKAVLFTLGSRLSNWDEAQIVVQSLETGDRRVVIDRGKDARYLPSGHLVYALGSTLFALTFDLETLAPSSGPVSVLEYVRHAVGGFTAAAQFSVSRSGTVVYVPGGTEESWELAWVGRDGKRAPVTERRAGYRWPRVSPDGRRLAVQILGNEGPDVWILDLERDTSSRLTVGGHSERPVWSPDGEWVAFASNRSGKYGIYRRRADFSGEAELLLEADENVFLEDWSRDGWLLYYTESRDKGTDIWAQSLEGDEGARPIVQSRFYELEPSFSPDGRWVAYQADASGQWEIYVTAFPDSGGRHQISTAGGTHPFWSRQGDQIFFSPPGLPFAVADVTTKPEFHAGVPRELFELPYPQRPGRDFDVTADGQRFVAVVGTEESEQQQINVVVNWLEEVKARVAIE